MLDQVKAWGKNTEESQLFYPRVYSLRSVKISPPEKIVPHYGTFLMNFTWMTKGVTMTTIQYEVWKEVLYKIELSIIQI